jgi:hypothetical protein
MDKSIDFTFPDIKKWTRDRVSWIEIKKTEKSHWQRAIINTIDFEKTVTQKNSK